jgi:hypothetical protein
MYFVEKDGKTVTEWDSGKAWEMAHGKEPRAALRLFAVHPDVNANVSVDADTGRYIYISPGTNRAVVLGVCDA